MTIKKEEMQINVLEHLRGGKGNVEMQVMFQEKPANVKLFNHVRLEPGCSIGYHPHEGECEIYYIISGTGTVSDDGKLIEVKPGDAMCTPTGHAHSIENTGSEDLHFVAAIILA